MEANTTVKAKSEVEIGKSYKVLLGGNGAYGAVNFIGTVIEKPEKEPEVSLGEYWGDMADVYIQCEDVVWGLCKGWELVEYTIEKADPSTFPWRKDLGYDEIEGAGYSLSILTSSGKHIINVFGETTEECDKIADEMLTKVNQ